MLISLGYDVAVSFQYAASTVTEVMEKQSQRVTVSDRSPLFEYHGMGDFQRNGSLHIIWKIWEELEKEVREKQIQKIGGKIKPNNLTLESFPGSSVVKNPSAMQEMASSIPGLERYLGEGNGNPLQNPCLVNSMDRGAQRDTVHGVAKSQRLNDQQYYYCVYRRHIFKNIICIAFLKNFCIEPSQEETIIKSKSLGFLEENWPVLIKDLML